MPKVNKKRVVEKLKLLVRDLESGRISATRLRESTHEWDLRGPEHRFDFSYAPKSKQKRS